MFTLAILACGAVAFVWCRRGIGRAARARSAAYDTQWLDQWYRQNPTVHAAWVAAGRQPDWHLTAAFDEAHRKAIGQRS